MPDLGAPSPTAPEPRGAAAQAHGIRLEVVRLPTVKHGFILRPHRWMVERSFAWMACFRRLACDYERLAETLAGLPFVAFALLLAQRFISYICDVMVGLLDRRTSRRGCRIRCQVDGSQGSSGPVTA